jgi:FAD/FMN-containing dehydrogenase
MSTSTTASRDQTPPGQTQTLQAFRQRLRGPLLAAGDTGFEEATLLWNAMIDKTPALVVQPTGTADVVAAVDFARDNELVLSVRGGGHNIAGTALADGGLTIDMSRLRGIHVDPEARTVTVQAGCLLGDVDRETQLHGLATPLGFVSEVGVAGLTLGGGLGYLTRRFGWTVDNLLEVEIVTADGRVRRASRDQNADLFWAIRGAGANLGVVTSFTFGLHEVGPTVYGGLIAGPFERADEILRAYRTITTDAPRELAVWLLLLHAPPAPFVPPEWHGEKICAMAVCYSGDLDGVDEAIAPLRALGDPVVDLLREQPYVEVQSYLDETEPKGIPHYWKTEYLAELSDDLLSTMRDVAAETHHPEGEIGVLHVGGALNDHDEHDGAVGNRDGRYALGVKAMWDPHEPDGQRFPEWVRGGWERLRPYSTGRTYINFQTADEDDERIRATYGANFDRLAEINQSYDPDNLFRSNRNIRPRRDGGAR